VDLVDAASYHQLVLNTEGRSPKTLRLYLIYEKRFLAFLEARGIPPVLEALNPLNARQALLWFQQRRVGTRDGEVAARMFLNVLKTWATFLAREGVWDDSPLQRVRRVKIRRLERKPYSRAEVNALLGACELSRTPARDRLLVHLLLDTGARISEAMGLCLADVDLDGRTIRVLGKGNRERTIPIGVSSVPDGGPLLRALRSYLKVREQLVRRHPGRDNDRLFLTLQGFPLTGDGGTDVVKRLGDVAGIDGAIPHRFRHTFASIYLTQYAGDEQGLRRILGHVSQEVLANYVHIAQQVIADRAGRMAPSQHWLREGSR
jgi:integrase/recombinase XerD